MSELDPKLEEVIPVGRANLVSFLMLIPIVVVSVLPFILIYGSGTLVSGFMMLSQHRLLVLLGFLLLVFIHEGLHAITWASFTTSKLKSVSFGIKWTYLTPYCHCKEPLKRKHYILGGIMPGLVTGMLPLIVAYITASGWILIVSVILLAAAGGDLLVLFRVLKYSNDYIFWDHPSEIGFRVVKKDI